ncbi:hypothetical protein, partial [Virgibacillus dokdonensis]
FLKNMKARNHQIQQPIKNTFIFHVLMYCSLLIAISFLLCLVVLFFNHISIKNLYVGHFKMNNNY